MWECVCDCGTIKPIGQHYLLNGSTISCTCYQKTRAGIENVTHGLSKSRFYQTWKNMLHRCYEPSTKGYDRYGGRGIRVCDEWQDVRTFVAWCEEQNPPKGYQIDRIDNDGNYEPNNCRFVSREQNMRNRSSSTYYTINGETLDLADWCEKYNMNYQLVQNRISKLHWDCLKALTPPIISPAKYDISYLGKTQNLAQWCRELGVNYDMVYQRITDGHWDPLDALITPPKK